MSISVDSNPAVFSAGSLVHARGRDWVVLPGSDANLVVVRPLGGGEDDIAALLPRYEEVREASFGAPTPDDLGDDRSARLLRDALRIGFRSSGGPFRCLAGLAVEPRPYQLVPLLLALRQETVRLLIADDVGIGKTIEAGLVAAELLAQGSARGLTILCPPSLAMQWQQELNNKFGLESELVLPGTVRRLERGLAGDESIFTRYPVTIVSTDFIKSDRRRHEFLRAAPDLIIVDEAHSSVNDDNGRGGSGRTQRFRLLHDLAADDERHMILVTATPHSGNENAFRNLVGLLDERLQEADLSNDAGRRLLADHMVQRRRADVRHYLQQDTQFPSDRQVQEIAYRLTPSHRALFDDVLAYVRGQVQDRSGTALEQRVRWWSALSLLRAMASSPAAAAATLGTRSATVSADSAGRADSLGRAEVLDLVEDDALDGADSAPGALGAGAGSTPKAYLKTMQLRAQELAGRPDDDAKLAMLVKQIKGLLKDGFQPIVFCRFIQTAHYVAQALRPQLRKVEIGVVTGELAADERSARVAEMAEAAGDGPKVLVATDCLSEGVNLQNDFQAVIHYDLAWNPTRHEQREGRVDRFGQPSDVVRALLIYGEDTGIDGIILDVLLRKHESIRKDLGISVAVPPQTDQVVSALVEGVLMRNEQGEQLAFDFEMGAAVRLEEEWRSTAEAESRSRSRFAQGAIHPEEVQAAIERARASLGAPGEVREFVDTAFRKLGATVTAEGETINVELSGTPIGLRDALTARRERLTLVPDLPAPKDTAVLRRTDPQVMALARFVLDGALDPALDDRNRPARRCGLIRTDAVQTTTIALLVRVRSHVTLPGRDGTRTQVAEEARVVAFTGSPSSPTWLSSEKVESLLQATPHENVPVDVAVNMARSVLQALPALREDLDDLGRQVTEELREAHVTVRRSARGDRAGGLTVQGLMVSPQLPVDILGVYVYAPTGDR